MEQEATTSFWIAFFVEAGIPPAAAANYSIVFTDNRIQKNMLLDLSKDLLKDMGINVLGDIIAILKHAKVYHEKAAREKVLATDKETSVLKATRHLNEMLKEDSSKLAAAVVPVTKSVVTTPKETPKPSPPKKIKLTKPEVVKEVNEESSGEREEVVELKRKVIAPRSTAVLPKKSSVTPVATASKTVKKTSVFERLGESNVTSTTPEIPESASTSTKSSVFRRLGGQEKEAEKAPVKVVKPVQPVFKKIAPVSRPTVAETRDVINRPKLRMDTETVATKQSARDRLGLESREVRKRDTRSPGVKRRLGDQKVTRDTSRKNPTNVTSSVFSRLTITKRTN